MSYEEVTDPNTLIPLTAPPLRDKRTAHAATITKPTTVLFPQFELTFEPGDVIVKSEVNGNVVWERHTAKDFDDCYEVDDLSIYREALKEAGEFCMKRCGRDAREGRATPEYYCNVFLECARVKLTGVRS